MDFETTLKILVSIAAAVAIPVAAYAAIVATRAIWVKGQPTEAEAMARLEAEVDDIRARMAGLEAGQARVLELEERLDFAERMLAQHREREAPRIASPSAESR